MVKKIKKVMKAIDKTMTMETMIDTEFKTEFIKIMDEVFKDFDIEFEFSIFDFFKFEKKK
jgi:division protein CdvB (Snf7/Vps24/ESCRT-III family)